MNGRAARFAPYALAFAGSLCVMVLELVAARLVARIVGMSLPVWTSVIGVMLAGICLGNFLGGRLADRYDARRTLGPIYALGAALTLAVLWMNATLGQTSGISALPTATQILVVVTLDFLVPATVLGMIGPIVAKIAVDESTRTGSAIGDVYFLGAVGSIVGTFLAGFVLMYYAGTTTIVTLVAATLALLACLTFDWAPAKGLALLAAAALGMGSVPAVAGSLSGGSVRYGWLELNPLVLAGHVLAAATGLLAVVRMSKARLPQELEPMALSDGERMRVSLRDLAILSFLISLAFMAYEMAAGRLVTRHLGSSIYGWTSVIGVMLGGLSVGNWLGGRFANKITRESQLSWFFLASSILLMATLFLESPPMFLEAADISGSVLSRAITMSGFSWWQRVLIVVFVLFFPASVALGTVSPALAKLAIDRLRRDKRTGTAIGQVYAWGMVGSLVGTFASGFFLIDVLGTKGVILLLAAVLAVTATMLGSVLHAIWAGVPLCLCIIAFVPFWSLPKQAVAWGVADVKGVEDTTDDEIAYTDESNYYWIKVTNEPEALGQKRTIVLDNLIHGYFLLGHPEHIEYDYEYIYAHVTRRAVEAKAKTTGVEDVTSVPFRTLFLGGGAYTFPRHLQFTYRDVKCDVAEIDPAVTEANYRATGLPRETSIKTTFGDARQFVERAKGGEKYDLVYGDAFNDFSVPWHLTTREFNEKVRDMLTPQGVYMINIIDVYESDERADEIADDSWGERGKKAPTDEERQAAREARRVKARGKGGFLGSWVKTAKQTFEHVYVFGTDDNPGNGMRETFVVVASMQPLDLAELGKRAGDPKFSKETGLGESKEEFESKVYGPKDMEQLEVRSRGIILTDDYAPVENLLAPVAATRGDDE